MKIHRQIKVKELVERLVIRTQDELADALRSEGIDVTQATVSRDIKEMMLVKVPTGDGGHRLTGERLCDEVLGLRVTPPDVGVDVLAGHRREVEPGGELVGR